MNRVVLFKCVIIVSCCYIAAAIDNTCSYGVDTCDWYDWGAWGACTETCGGGIHSRTRSICCIEGYKDDPYECLKNCSYPVSETYQTNTCNEFCNNGGTFDGSRCECLLGTSGSCCENGSPILQTTAPTTTAKITTEATTKPTTKTTTESTTKPTTKTTTKPTTKTTTKTTTEATTKPTTKTTTESTTKPTTKTTTKPTTKTTTEATTKPTTKTTTGTTSTAKTTTEKESSSSLPLDYNGASKVKQDCNSNKYADCRCSFGVKKTKTRSIFRDIQFSGYGAIIGFLFSVGSYALWNCCISRKKYHKPSGVTPTKQFLQ